MDACLVCNAEVAPIRPIVLVFERAYVSRFCVSPEISPDAPPPADMQAGRAAWGASPAVCDR